MDRMQSSEQVVTIYALCDPCTGALRYIGQTRQLLQRRRAQHLSDRRSCTAAKAAWLADLRVRGLAPHIEVLERTDVQGANAAERRHIRQARQQGEVLLNGTLGGSRQSALRPRPQPPVQTRRHEPALDGRALRARRDALGISQGKLARALGVESNTIARWERGVLAIANPTMLSLALCTLEREAFH